VTPVEIKFGFLDLLGKKTEYGRIEEGEEKLFEELVEVC
jgi:hypothetical protein